MAKPDTDICIASVDDDACALYFQRNNHITGEVSFFTTLEFDGEETNIRISKQSASELRDWLSKQLTQ